MIEAKPLPKRVKIIFGIFLLFMGLASALGDNQIQKINNAHASLTWPTTEGKIIASGVKDKTSTSHSGGNIRHSVSYFADVKYEYTIQANRYSSEKISFGDYGSSDRNRVEEIISRYPNGKIVQVYHNPSDPSMSVLEPGAPMPTYVPIGLGALMILAGGGLLFSLLPKKRG